MNETSQKNSFDQLVAGITPEERKFLLDKISGAGADASSQTMQAPIDDADASGDLQTRLKTESVIYRFFLWLRSFFTKNSSEEIYNQDLIGDLARKINRTHPGIIDFSHGLLKSLFYEKLKELKSCSDFFKPYIAVMNDNPGEFYVFLSSFIAPEISDQINSSADPYSIPFDREVTAELRTSLIRKMDSVLKTINPDSRKNLYTSIKSLEWLRQLTELPYIHLIAQFTAIVTDSYTCPLTNAQADFPAFTRVLINGMPIQNEALEALFLFPQKKNAKNVALNSDIEKALNDFIAKSVSTLSMIQMFITTVPMRSLSRVVFCDYEWQPSEFGGGEDWFSKYREEWKRIFDERWEAWLRDRKKNQLASVLNTNFGLDEFPELPFRPWAELWGGIPFHCEMTAGFLAWFKKNMYQDAVSILNVLLLEGVFINNENRAELSEALNSFSDVNSRVDTFVETLSPHGTIGMAFDQLASSNMRSLKGQAKVDSIMLTAETDIHEMDVTFCRDCRSIELVLHGILDEDKDSHHDSLQNLMTIRGHDNGAFREKLSSARLVLKNAQSLLAEIEPLDLPRGSVPVTAAPVEKTK